MEKITGNEAARRKRIQQYKKGIVYVFLAMTLISMLTGLFLIKKVDKLQGNVDDLLSDKKTQQTESVKWTFADSPVGDQTQSTDETAAGETDFAVKTNSNLTVRTDDSSSAAEVAMQEITQAGKSKAAKNKVPKRVYLTFDDGPSVYTGEILDILKKNDVKATFFVVGKENQFDEYYKRIVDEGHTIGMHSYSHIYEDVYASVEAFGDELTRLNDLIYDVTGTRSTIFRFPGGSSNTVAPLPIQQYIAYLNEHNINYYDWNALNGDAVTCGLSPTQLVNNIMKDVEQNRDSIVLMHDMKSTHTTVESLQSLINILKKKGYEILPINADTPLVQHVSCNSVEE